MRINKKRTRSFTSSLKTNCLTMEFLVKSLAFRIIIEYEGMAPISQQFQELKLQQLTVFAKDTEVFIQAQQQRENQYNSLMYRMRKQLMQG